MNIDWHCVCGDSAPAHSSRSDGEYCHGHCQKTDHDCAGKGYRPIKHSTRNAAQTAILAESERRFLPKAFTCDLSTDYQTLADYDGPFVFVLRTNGTELYRLDYKHLEPSKVHCSLKMSRAAYEYWTDASEGHSDNQSFYWTGGTDAVLLPVTQGYALERFDEAIERFAPSLT